MIVRCVYKAFLFSSFRTFNLNTISASDLYHHSAPHSIWKESQIEKGKGRGEENWRNRGIKLERKIETERREKGEREQMMNKRGGWKDVNSKILSMKQLELEKRDSLLKSRGERGVKEKEKRRGERGKKWSIALIATSRTVLHICWIYDY